PAQVRALAAAVCAGHRLERRLAAFVLAAPGIARRRRANRALAAAAVLVVVALGVGAVKATRLRHATASGAFMPIYGAERVLDGDPNTDWVANGNAEPWIDVTLPGVQRIR